MNSNILSMKVLALEIEVSLVELPPACELEAMWRDIESRAKCSFFTSWSWIGAWLKTYAREAQVQGLVSLLVARLDGRVVALGILCRAALPRFLGSAGTAILLHQIGSVEDESAFIEYNGFLIDCAVVHDASAAVLGFVSTSDAFVRGDWAWDEFCIAGADLQMLEAIHTSKLPYRTKRQSSCPWVDFSQFGLHLNGYLATLSSNTRGQIRRSIRILEQNGPLTLEVARNLAEAQAFMTELETLHQESWLRRMKSMGAYSSPLFKAFTAALLTLGYGTGNIDVVRLTVGRKTIGVLLNFVYAGHVYAYQSGFMFDDDNRLKPGLVSHALAIAHYRQRHLQGYHFMAGDARYKSSLGLSTENLTWLVLHRFGLRSLFKDMLGSIKARLTQT